jgi:hypothetical protein
MTGPKTLAPGTYVQCQSCGRVLPVLCPTRSMVCSCGARLPAQPSAPREEASATSALHKTS